MSTSSDLTDNRKMPYWFNILIGIDQLGNAIAHGNPDNTISARVGYFASEDHKSRLKFYWKALERTIDITFKPIQGPGHCRLAWQAEADETDSQGTYIARIILGIFVEAGCFFIAVFLWLAVLLFPSLRFKSGDRQYDTWRQARRSVILPRAAEISQ